MSEFFLIGLLKKRLTRLALILEEFNIDLRLEGGALTFLGGCVRGVVQA
jgi:hypothetical protein